MTSLHTTKWSLNISRTNIDCKTRLDYDDVCTIGSDTTGLLQLRATGQGTGNNCSMISYRTALDNSLRWIDAIHFFLPGIWSGIIWGNMTWYPCMHLYHSNLLPFAMPGAFALLEPATWQWCDKTLPQFRAWTEGTSEFLMFLYVFTFLFPSALLEQRRERRLSGKYHHAKKTLEL